MQHADKLDIDACIKNAISGFQYDGKSDNLKYNCSTVEDLTLDYLEEITRVVEECDRRYLFLRVCTASGTFFDCANVCGTRT